LYGRNSENQATHLREFCCHISTFSVMYIFIATVGKYMWSKACSAVQAANSCHCVHQPVPFPATAAPTGPAPDTSQLPLDHRTTCHLTPHNCHCTLHTALRCPTGHVFVFMVTPAYMHQGALLKLCRKLLAPFMHHPDKSRIYDVLKLQKNLVKT